MLVAAWVQQACLKFYKVSYPLISGGESLPFSIYQTIHQTKAAQVAIDSGSSDAGFYQAKLHTARFYFERILPRTQTLAITIQSGASNLMEIDEQYFNS